MASSRAIAPSACRPGFPELFLGIGVAEIIIGLAALLLADIAGLFSLFAWLLGAIGIVVLLVCLRNPQAMKVYDLFAATLMVAYGSGSLNSLVAYANNDESLLSAAVVSEYWLTHTLGLVAVACGCLHLAGRADRDGYLFRVFAIDPVFRDRTLLLAMLVLGAYAWLVFTGTIGFRGNVMASDIEYRVSRTGAIVLLLATPVGALAVVAMLEETRRLRAILLAVAGISLLIAQLGLGRRIFLFSLLTYAFAILAFRPPRRVLNLRIISVAVIAIGLLHAATSFFYAMRLADIAADGPERPNMVQLLPKAMEIYLDDSGALQDKISANLKSRTFVLQYLADITKRETEIGPLLGLNALRALIFATPNVLYPGKYHHPLFIQEESLINPHFLLPVVDSASSVFTAGTADFGYVGLLLYPLLLCIGCSLFIRVFRSVTSPMATLLLGVFICQDLMSVENDLAHYFSFALRAAVITSMAAVFLYPRGRQPNAPRLALPFTMQRGHR